MDYLGIPDLARALGVSRQAVWDRFKRGTLPPPDIHIPGKCGPLWKRETLAGVLGQG